MKKLTLTLFILIISIVQSQTMFKARVSAIKDGDTVVVINGLYTQITLRLAEVDCPEKNQPFGTRAKEYTSDQIYNKEIQYIVTDKDRYNRSIAMIFYDEDRKYLSAEIIKAGMGWHYKRYSTSQELATFEIEAREAKKGLWVDEKPIEPSEWRRK